MLNSTFSSNVTSFGTSIIIIASVISSVGIIFNLTLIIYLIHYGKFTKHSNKNNSRRVGLLHSINTYIHLIGILSTLLIMCIGTLYRDLYGEKHVGSSPPWHCHFIGYLMPVFAAGVYGSCFLQALFRFCRIILPTRNLFQKLAFHLQLILAHWIFIIILLLPMLSRSDYISSDHFCLCPFDDRLSATYIATVTTVIPVTGIFILYVKIIFYIKHHSQSKKRWRHIKRDIATIRRILLLVIIILQTSGTGIVLWIITFFDQRLHPLFYRLLRFLIILCMTICSIALLLLSPQLNRAIRRKSRKDQIKSHVPKRTISSNNMEEMTPLEILSNL